MVEHLPRHTACQMPPTYTGCPPLSRGQALVAVVDDVLGPPLANRHLHRVQHQFGAQVVCHRPADDLAAPSVEHDGEIEEPRHRRHISDVGNPELVRSGGAEVAVDQVGRRPVVLVPPGCCRAAVPMAGAHQARLTHQTSDPLAAVPLSAPTQIGMDARRPVGLPRTGMHRLDALQQGRVGRGVGGRWPLQPGVVARLGHAEHACHCGNRERGLVRAHEPEEPDGSVPVSRANQAAAFDRISRSGRNCLFSRRSRVNSSRSAAVRPGATSSRRPSFRSAWETQARMEWPLGSNSRARSSGLRPARTRSTICRRNSGEYGGRVLGIGSTSGKSFRVSTKPGQSHGITTLPCFVGDADPLLVRVPGTDLHLYGTLWLLTQGETRKTKRVRLFTEFVSRRLAAYAPLLAGLSISRD